MTVGSSRFYPDPGGGCYLPILIFQHWILFVGADIIRPPPDLHRAGGVAKQAAVGSAEGGAVKQSEAILDGVFLSSPILSFARKRKDGKKKKRILFVGFLSTQEDADAALGQCSFFSWKERALRERTAFQV